MKSTVKMWKELEILILQQVVIIFISVLTKCMQEKSSLLFPMHTFGQHAVCRIRSHQSTHFTTSINIVYFPFHVNLTYIFTQYYKPAGRI
jgi:argininosuccinate lyase